MYTEVNRQCVQIHSTHIHATWFMWARPPCRPGPCMYAHTHIRTHVTILHFQNTLPFLSSVAYLRLHYPEARLQRRLMTACSRFIRWSARGGAERKRRHANAGITASVELPWNSFRPWILFKGKANNMKKSNIAPLLNFRPKHKQRDNFSSEGMGGKVIAFEKNTHIPLGLFT